MSRPRPTPRPRPEHEPRAAEPLAAEPLRPTRSGRRAQQKRHESRRLRSRVGRTVSTLLVVVGVAGFVTLRVRDAPSAAGPRPTPSASASADPQAVLTDEGTAQAFVGAAASELVAVTAVDYRHVDDALTAGSAVSTGAFATRFRAALTGSAAAAIVANQTTTDVAVLQAGIGAVNTAGTTATVLIFARVNQTGVDVTAAGRSVLATLKVSMVRQGSQYLIADLAREGNAGLPPGTAGLRAAAEAAREEVAATLTYRRASITADLLHAQNGATGSLLKQLVADATAVRSSVTRNGADLTGAVTAVAVQQAAGDSVTMLVAATGTSTDAAGKQSVVTDGRYVVTVVRVSGIWLVASLTEVS